MERNDTDRDLRAAGLRATAQRAAVLEQLRDHGGHQSVATVSSAVRSRLGRVSPQAVYDALDALSRTGLVTRIDPGGSPALFEAAGPPHHHLVCRRCGAVADVELGGPTPLAPVDDHGWSVDGAELTFWGTCPACLTGAPGPDRPDPIPPADDEE